MKQLLSLFALSCSTLAIAQADAAAALRAAQQAYAVDQLDSALVLTDQAIAGDAALPGALKLRGDIHQRLRQFDLAMADYKAAEKQNPADPRLYVSRSALHITEGNAKAGLRYADKAIDLDPANADAWYNRAWALYQANELDAALKSVRKALDLKPGFPEGLYLSGVVKAARYDEKEGAMEIARALEAKPDIPGGLMSLGVVLFEDGRYQEAIDRFTQVIASDTTELMAAYYYRADSHYNLGDKESACADWLRSMKLGDKDAAFIKRNYCDTDANKIPKKPKRKPRSTTIQF